MSNKASLADVLNYEAEQHLSDDEKRIIQSTFRGNNHLIHILRKVMIPTMEDMSLPIEDFGKDTFNAGRDWASMAGEEVKAIVLARQDAMAFIFGGLVKLKVIANDLDKTEDEIAEAKKKDSSK